MRTSGWRKSPAVDGRMTMPRHCGTDEYVFGIDRIDGDARDRAAVGNSEAARHQRPRFSQIGRFVKADARLRISRSVGLASADIESFSRRIGRVKDDGADSIRWNPVARGMPVQM